MSLPKFLRWQKIYKVTKCVGFNDGVHVVSISHHESEGWKIWVSKDGNFFSEALSPAIENISSVTTAKMAGEAAYDQYINAS